MSESLNSVIGFFARGGLFMWPLLICSIVALTTIILRGFALREKYVMTSKRRPASIAFPRQVAMYLARELTKASLNEIGDAFGGRDHGTVLHACKLVKKRMKEQDNIRQTISFIDSALQR